MGSAELLVVLVDSRLVVQNASTSDGSLWPRTWESLAVFFAAYGGLATDQRIALIATNSERAALIGADVCAAMDWQGLRQETTKFLLSDSGSSADPPHLASGLSRALCYANYMRKAERKIPARVLIMECSNIEADLSTQGPGLLSCAFAAQAENVTVDCLSLGDQASTLLRQVVNIAGGKHHAMSPLGASAEQPFGSLLLQTLLFHFLASAVTRKDLNMVPDNQNMAAVCVCHGKMCDIAYICSSCLSVYCTDNIAICPGCRTRFRPERAGINRRLSDLGSLELSAF